ncbi:MAG: OmpA family protein [Campylobacterota bacterium]|nr:OmpA family protein [Campylobacterota bacterium]
MLKTYTFILLLLSSLLTAQEIKGNLQDTNNTTNQNNTIKADDDNDNIENTIDKCPNTPQGVCVDQYGCTQIIKRVIYFHTESFKINKDEAKKIDDIIEIAKECYGYKLEIRGHTDSVADETYNNLLSKQRAMTIKKIFILHNINDQRVTTSWFGESKPSTTNVSDDGKSKNRRVEVIFK